MAVILQSTRCSVRAAEPPDKPTEADKGKEACAELGQATWGGGTRTYNTCVILLETPAEK